MAKKTVKVKAHKRQQSLKDALWHGYKKPSKVKAHRRSKPKKEKEVII